MSTKRIRSGVPWETDYAYSRAVVSDGWVFVSGTTGFDPATGRAPEGTVAQCARAFETIGRALTDAGASFADVVRVRYIVAPDGDFAACAETIRHVFGATPPAATMFRAALIDPSLKIEIEVTARLPG